MALVDETGVSRRRLSRPQVIGPAHQARQHRRTVLDIGAADARFHGGGAGRVKRNRDHFKALVFQLKVDCLPHGQVKATASVRAPAMQKDFLAAIVRQ